MKIRIHRTRRMPFGFTTVGFWRFAHPENRGTLHIYVATRLEDRRFYWAVLGHELIEAIYCWLLGITTETCDQFDEKYERWYASGKVPKEAEPGCDPKCPYHWGHMLGIAWEYFCIWITFASFEKYERACNRVMAIKTSPKNPR